jgi:hypothetical protein
MGIRAESTTATDVDHGRHPPARKGARMFTDFSHISLEIAELMAAREKLVMDAFSALEKHHALLAEMLVQRMGSRLNAARWMCKHQESFRGLTGYDMLAEGDTDSIWDEAASSWLS